MKWNFIVLSIKFFLMGFLFSFCRVPPTRFCTENSNQRTGFVLIKQELRISVFLFFNSSRVFLMVTPFYCRRTQWKYRRRVLAIGGGNRFLEIVNGHSILLSSNPTTNVRNVFCRLVERARWGGKKNKTQSIHGDGLPFSLDAFVFLFHLFVPDDRFYRPMVIRRTWKRAPVAIFFPRRQMSDVLIATSRPSTLRWWSAMWATFFTKSTEFLSDV